MKARNKYPTKRGGTRKIADVPPDVSCTHPEHGPPKQIVFEPGTYEHECPSCGKKTIFIVPRVRW